MWEAGDAVTSVVLCFATAREFRTGKCVMAAMGLRHFCSEIQERKPTNKE
jgi:hypothetical protein